MKTETKTSRDIQLIRLIASTCCALRRCEETHNTEWQAKHNATLDACEDFLPSGSGVDCGTKIDRENTTGNVVYFTLSYHHMNENGMYDGWNDYRVACRPSFEVGVDLTITGRNRNQIKEYLADLFSGVCTESVSQDSDGNLTRIL